MARTLIAYYYNSDDDIPRKWHGLYGMRKHYGRVDRVVDQFSRNEVEVVNLAAIPVAYTTQYVYGVDYELRALISQKSQICTEIVNANPPYDIFVVGEDIGYLLVNYLTGLPSRPKIILRFSKSYGQPVGVYDIHVHDGPYLPRGPHLIEKKDYDYDCPRDFTQLFRFLSFKPLAAYISRLNEEGIKQAIEEFNRISNLPPIIPIKQ